MSKQPPPAHPMTDFRVSRRAALSSVALGIGALALRAPVGASLGCERARSEGPDRQEVLRQTVSIVLVSTFVELADRADAFAVAAMAVKSSPAAVSINDARAKWKAARAVWKRAEAFSHGPSDDLAVTGGAIDAWPAAAAKIDALVGGSDGIDEVSVTTLSANMRGFPGTEHLLFDSAAIPDAADRLLLDDPRAPRRRELLAAQGADLAKKCRSVRDAWDGPAGYGHELAEAGHGSKIFSYQRDAVDKIVTGMLALAELMLVAKLAKPLGLDTGGPPHPELEEAPRSDTSLAWIEENLLGLQAVYECRLGDRRGLSFADDVVSVAPGADRSFRQAMEAAFSAVRAIKTPMRVLLAGERASLVSLHGAVQAVKRSINTDIASALGASIGFGYSDTD